MDNFELVKTVHSLRDAVQQNTSEYYHSNPLATSMSRIILPDRTRSSFKVQYDIKDMLLSGALTNSPILITGGTDTGKTTLAKLVMNALLGEEEEGWHRIDIDLDFGQDSYADVDFSQISEGGRASEMFDGQPYLDLPGLILDEMNRSHAKKLNKLLHILEHEITLPNGQRRKIGHNIGGDERYQFLIANINEGYSGTFSMDRALRRRTVIEIPIDSFPATPSDRLQIQRSKEKIPELRNTESHLEDVLTVYKELRNIHRNPEAGMFLSYLSSFDFCIRSEGGKGEISSEQRPNLCSGTGFSPDTPRGAMGGTACEYLKSFNNNMCPNVRAITPGIDRNLNYIAKGLALIRATKFADAVYGVSVKNESKVPLSYEVTDADRFREHLRSYTGTNNSGLELAREAIKKYSDNLAVEMADISAAFSFVALSKLDMNPHWVNKNFKGRLLAPVQYFHEQASDAFLDRLRGQEAVMDKVANGTANNDDISYLKNKYELKHPWMWHVVQAHISEPKVHLKSLGIYG